MFPFALGGPSQRPPTQYWYFEASLSGPHGGGQPYGMGIATSSANLNSYCGADANGWGILFDGGFHVDFYHNGSSVVSITDFGPTALMVAWDTAGNLYLGWDGNFYDNTQTPTSLPTTPNFTNVFGNFLPMLSVESNSEGLSPAFVSGGQTYLPTGFSAWGGSLNLSDKASGITVSGGAAYGNNTDLRSIRGNTSHAS